MQITINIPDNLPQAVVEQQISEFEQKINQFNDKFSKQENRKAQNYSTNY